MIEDVHFKEIRSLLDQRVIRNSIGRPGRNLGIMQDLNHGVDQTRDMKKFKGLDIGITEKR